MSSAHDRAGRSRSLVPRLCAADREEITAIEINRVPTTLIDVADTCAVAASLVLVEFRRSRMPGKSVPNVLPVNTEPAAAHRPGEPDVMDFNARFPWEKVQGIGS